MIRLLNMLTLALTVVISFGLYTITNETRDKREELRGVTAEIAAERETIDVLEAEWQLLVQPAKIQELNEHFLQLQPVSLGRLRSIDSVPFRPDPSSVQAQVLVTPPALPKRPRLREGGV